MAKAPTKRGGAATEPAPAKPQGGAITSQLSTGGAVAPLRMGREGETMTLPNGIKIKVKEQVTLRVFPQVPGVPLLVTSRGEIYKGEKIDRGKSKDMDAADLMKVEDVATRELGLIIVGAVLRGEIERSYPNKSYLGKTFLITTGEKAEGKRYRPVTLFEVEPQDE